eukprot:IDg1743t1
MLEAQSSTVLKVDSTAAIAVTQTQARTKKSKYMKVHYHYIRHKVESGMLKLRHCPSRSLSADALTNQLPINSFVRYRKAMNVANESSEHFHGYQGTITKLHILSE